MQRQTSFGDVGPQQPYQRPDAGFHSYASVARNNGNRTSPPSQVQFGSMTGPQQIPMTPQAQQTQPFNLAAFSHNDDPFVNHEPYPYHNRAPNAVSPSQGKKSSILASLIRAGAADDGTLPPIDHVQLPRYRRETGRSNAPQAQDHFSPLDVRSPVVQHWGAHMIEAQPDPPFMQAARAGVTPHFEQVMDHMPFINPCEAAQVPEGGVVVVKNIPYAATKPEIIAAIGRNSRIVSQPAGSPIYAIHIVMERSTGKTMDCYIELETKSEARGIIAAYRSRCDRGRTPRVGDRHIDVQLSSQEELMQQTFPKARGIRWEGAVPVPVAAQEAYDSGFMGFVTVEECAMIYKHAESPQRSPFVSRALNRAYEAIISILYKYPWHQPHLITIGERALLFKTAASMLKILIKAVIMAQNTLQLSSLLLQEVICAILTVPFSHKQKNEIVELVRSHDLGEYVLSIGYLSLVDHAGFWPFEVLDKKLGVGANVIQYYASLLHQGSATDTRRLSEAQIAEISASPFGALRAAYNCEDMRSVFLDDAAESEWMAIHEALRNVVPEPKAPTKLITDTASGASSDHDTAPHTSPLAVQHIQHQQQRQTSVSISALRIANPDSQSLGPHLRRGGSNEAQKAAPAGRAMPSFDPTPGAQRRRGTKEGIPPVEQLDAIDEESDSGRDSPTPTTVKRGSTVPTFHFAGLGIAPRRTTAAPKVATGSPSAQSPLAKSPMTFNPEATDFSSPRLVKAGLAAGPSTPKTFAELAASRGIKVGAPGTRTAQSPAALAEYQGGVSIDEVVRQA